MRSRLRPADGRKRSWTSPTGAVVVLPIWVDVWSDDPHTGERDWTISCRVDLFDGQPGLSEAHFIIEDRPLDLERLQRDFRWQSPIDIVKVWLPDVIAAGGDPFELEPPTDWWVLEGRHELTEDFLREIAEEYLRQGRGYAKAMAIRYRTNERTVRSWIDKARERGVLGKAVGRGKVGAQ